MHRDADLSAPGLIPKPRRQGGWEPSLLHRDSSPGRGGHDRWRSGEIIEEITGTGQHRPRRRMSSGGGAGRTECEAGLRGGLLSRSGSAEEPDISIFRTWRCYSTQEPDISAFPRGTETVSIGGNVPPWLAARMSLGVCIPAACTHFLVDLIERDAAQRVFQSASQVGERGGIIAMQDR